MIIFCACVRLNSGGKAGLVNKQPKNYRTMTDSMGTFFATAANVLHENVIMPVAI
jgi:hypothetical protein